MTADALYVFEQETSYRYLMTEHFGKDIPCFPGVWEEGEHKGKNYIQNGMHGNSNPSQIYQTFYFNNYEIPCISFINNFLIGTYCNYLLLIEMTTFTQIQFTFINFNKFKSFYKLIKEFDELPTLDNEPRM